MSASSTTRERALEMLRWSRSALDAARVELSRLSDQSAIDQLAALDTEISSVMARIVEGGMRT